MNNSSTTASGEIMLFGVRLAVDPIRKSVSLNNLSQYALPHEPLPEKNASPGYASADDHRSPSAAAVIRERKRGVPWTEDEHKLFLLGLQKVGKGDWRGISRSFVKTRTPTQVASHAQKYFLRRCNLNRRRRRSSLFDITTETVTLSGNSAMDKNGSNVNVSCQSTQLLHTSVQGTSSEISNISFSASTTMGGIGGHHLPEMSPNNNNLIQSTPTLRMADFDLNLSLTLSREPPFEAVPSFSNGDSMISVV